MSLCAHEVENKFLQQIRKGGFSERLVSLQTNARILTLFRRDISDSLGWCLNYCMKDLYIQVI